MVLEFQLLRGVEDDYLLGVVRVEIFTIDGSGFGLDVDVFVDFGLQAWQVIVIFQFGQVALLA